MEHIRGQLKQYVKILLAVLILSYQVMSSGHLIYAKTQNVFSFTEQETNEVEKVIKSCGSSFLSRYS